MPMSADDFVPGWGLSDAQLTILSDMECIADETDKASDLYVAVPDILNETNSINDEARNRLRQYATWGWIDMSDTSDPGGVDVQLLAPGRQIVDDIRALRQDAGRRRRELREAVAHWVSDQQAQGKQRAEYSDFFDSRFGLWYGQKVTYQQYGEASTWLGDNGFATGVSGDVHGLIVVELTARGEAHVDAGRRLNDVTAAAYDPTPASVTSYVTHIVNSPGSNVAAGSPGAEQQSTVTITQEVREQAYAYADLLEDQLSAVNPG